MKTNFIFDKTMTSLERSLNLRSMNQKLIVSNIANMDTPRYKAFKMMVDENMQDTGQGGPQLTMTRTQAGHLSTAGKSLESGRVARVESNDLSLRGDGNTVELDTEMANLAENTLKYNTTTRIISNKFKLLKDVIKGGQ
ncbi:MAG: flagellar basal body rod protein FlgB [Deltaproteobacteria bacterium]|nr:flagellar basal body rod protein FlgB [Deltaproteobacteria bacterium]